MQVKLSLTEQDKSITMKIGGVTIWWGEHGGGVTISVGSTMQGPQRALVAEGGAKKLSQRGFHLLGAIYLCSTSAVHVGGGPYAAAMWLPMTSSWW